MLYFSRDAMKRITTQYSKQKIIIITISIYTTNVYVTFNTFHMTYTVLLIIINYIFFFYIYIFNILTRTKSIFRLLVAHSLLIIALLRI